MSPLQSHRVPRYLVKHYSGCWVWTSLGMKLTFKSVDWVDCLPLMWAGITQETDGLKGTKQLTLPKREFLLPDCLQTGTSAFSCLQTWTEMPALPGSQGCWSGSSNQQSWLLGLWTWMGAKLLALLGLQLADSPCRPWDSPASIIAWANLSTYLWSRSY